MIQSSITLMVIRKEFEAIYNRFTTKTYFVSILITSLMLVSCKDVKSQSGVYFENEEAETRYLQEQEDAKQFYLATIKLCMDEDYIASFGTYRESPEYIKNKNCCLQVVPKPFISPMEYYNHYFDGDKEIYDNQKNPFKLKEIRKEQTDDNEAIKKEAQRIDTNNLIIHFYNGWTVKRYDFNQEKLEISGGFSKLITSTSIVGPNIEIKPLLSNPFLMDMSIKEAENLFKYFDDNKGIRTQALPAGIFTKLTYSVNKPKEHWKSTFAVKIKKMEFFKTNEWDNKIGEINF